MARKRVPQRGRQWRVERQACAGTCSTHSPPQRSAAGIPATSDFNRGDNGAWATSRSTSAAAGAGTRSRPSSRRSAGANPDGVDRRGRRPTAAFDGRRDGALRLQRRVLTAQACRSVRRGAQVDARGGFDPAPHRSFSSRASAPTSCCKATASNCAMSFPAIGANLQDHLQIRARSRCAARNAEHARQLRCRQGAHRDRIRAHAQPSDGR